MVTYFHYTRKQRKIAMTLIWNALLALGIYIVASIYLPLNGRAGVELLNVIDILIWCVEIVLIGIAVYFWFSNKSIELKVTSRDFHYYDPTFGDYGFTVPIKDIVEIEQYTGIQQNFRNTFVVMNNGDRNQCLYFNYPIDIVSFFSAIKQANPNIKLPDHPYEYETRM